MADFLRSLSIFPFFNRHLDVLTFVLTFPVAMFFLFSPRMNSRLEAPASGSRWLRRLAKALAPAGKDPRGVKKGFVRLLRKLNWLFHDKLKLSPNANTGRRVSFVMMLFSVCLVSGFIEWWTKSSKSAKMSFDFRVILAEQASQQAWLGLWASFFLSLLYMLLLLLPFFLVRKNREFYFDMTALFMLIFLSFVKFFNCWYFGCCFGIPWRWGVYSNTLETTVFPVQLFEFAVGILMSALCILYMLYGKSYKPGRGCSLCMISYVVPRFYWEYLRYHSESERFLETNGILSFTMTQTVALIAVVLSIVWLFVLPLEKKLLDKLLKKL